MPADESELRLRLIRADDVPATNPLGDAYAFGLQAAKGELTAARRLPDGRLAWDFTLRVKEGAERPSFLGRFASGPAGDRFVYLAWRSIPGGVWINRVKARLSDLDWPLVRAAQAADRPLVAGLTGRPPGGGRVPVGWRLADD